MKSNERIYQRVLLFSLVALIIPTIAFPENFGTQLAKGSLVHALYELVFYGCMAFLLYRRKVLPELVQFAGICLVYRLGLGAVFGILIAAMYSMDLMVSISLGMSGYLPGILLHIAATPFILRPVAVQFFRSQVVPREISTPTSRVESPDRGRTSIAVSRKRGIALDIPAVAAVTAEQAATDLAETSQKQAAGDRTGFDRAVRYIGEDGSVQLAVVVDQEGLLMANYWRGEVDPESWAPLPLMLYHSNRQVLEYRGMGVPEKLDMIFEDRRIMIACAEGYYLLVVSERHLDDMLPIRVNQAMEIVRKYVTERYGHTPHPNAERIHVSGTE
jgi:predicted regulator of Ras-like GTPase activity (Roadblock/LC7/MglB family)